MCRILVFCIAIDYCKLSQRKTKLSANSIILYCIAIDYCKLQ